ncbi:hypothetical protein [Salipiger abyssi]|uniref:hypothetical protein n=1 Tax=Salipiger abyssi TaxID=1250539 RepID=UPI00405A1DC3
MAKRKTSEEQAADEDVRVIMIAAHTYQTGPSTRRTLPAGWKGNVPASLAAEIEKAGAGAKAKPAQVAATDAGAKAGANSDTGKTPVAGGEGKPQDGQAGSAPAAKDDGKAAG